jgi:hypothetical protein
MIRYFCDCCGEEIADTNRITGSDKGRLLGVRRSRLKPAGEPLQVEVTTALGSIWNGGHFCKYCVIEAVASQDDRPQAAPPASCWLVERRKDGRTTGFLGHANGDWGWMPTPALATRFARREDANGVAECIETDDVIVAEHQWG